MFDFIKKITNKNANDGTQPIAQRFLSLPPNLGNGLPKQGARVLINRFDYAGLDKRLGDQGWTGVAEVNEPAWQAAVYSFLWLDDLAAHGGEIAANKARELVLSWIDWLENQQNSTEAINIARQGDVVASRIVHLCRRATFLFSFNPPPELRERLLIYLSQEAYWLIENRRIVNRQDKIGQSRALCGAVLASLCLEGFQPYLSTLSNELQQELESLILPDGMIASRAPRDLVGMAYDLIGLKLAYKHAKQPVPAFITQAIEKVIPALRMVRHGDGGLALFHSSREGRKDLIDAILLQADVDHKAPFTLKNGGFYRLQSNQLTVIMDIGKPPKSEFSAHYHASPLAFELSHDADRIFTNCGACRLDHKGWNRAMRSTAAHNALNVGDRDAVDVNKPDPDFLVEYDRNDADGSIWVTASHNGYVKKMGAVVTRKLYMPADKTALIGEDHITKTKSSVPFALRFHVHPDVQITLVGENGIPYLQTKNGTSWWFHTQGRRVRLVDSVYLGGTTHIVSTQQIVIEDQTGTDETLISWALELVQ